MSSKDAAYLRNTIAKANAPTTNNPHFMSADAMSSGHSRDMSGGTNSTPSPDKSTNVPQSSSGHVRNKNASAKRITLPKLTLGKKSDKERQRYAALYEATNSVRERKRVEVWAERNQAFIDGQLDVRLLTLVPEFTSLAKAPAAHIVATTSKSTYRRNVDITNRMRINEDHNYGVFTSDQLEQTTDTLSNILGGWQASGDGGTERLSTLSRKQKIAIPAVGTDSTASLSSCPVASTPVAILVNVGDSDDAGKNHLSKLHGPHKLLLRFICELETIRALTGSSSFGGAVTAYHTNLSVNTATSSSTATINHFYALTRLLMEVRCLDLFLHATISGTVDLVGCQRLPSDVNGTAAGIPLVVSTLAHRAAVASEATRGVAADMLNVFAMKFPGAVAAPHVVCGALELLDTLSTFGDASSMTRSSAVRSPPALSIVSAPASSHTFGDNPFLQVQELFFSSAPTSALFVENLPFVNPHHARLIPEPLRGHGREDIQSRVRGFSQVVEGALVTAAIQHPRKLLDSLKLFTVLKSIAGGDPVLNSNGAGGLLVQRLIQRISPTTFQVLPPAAEFTSGGAGSVVGTSSKSRATHVLLDEEDDVEYVDPLQTIEKSQSDGWQRQADGLGYLVSLKPNKLLDVLAEQRFYDSCVASVGDKWIGEPLGRGVAQSVLGVSARQIHTPIGALSLTGVENLPRSEQSTFAQDVSLLLNCYKIHALSATQSMEALSAGFTAYQVTLDSNPRIMSLAANLSFTNPQAAASAFSAHHTDDQAYLEQCVADLQPVVSQLTFSLAAGVVCVAKTAEKFALRNFHSRGGASASPFAEMASVRELLRMVVVDSIKTASSEVLRHAISGWRWLVTSVTSCAFPVHVEVLQLVLEGLRWLGEERVGLFSGETDNSMALVEQGEQRRHHGSEPSEPHSRSPNHNFHSIHSMIMSFIAEVYLEPTSPNSADARVLGLIAEFGNWAQHEIDSRAAISFQPPSSEKPTSSGKGFFSTCHSSFSELMRFSSLMLVASSLVNRYAKLRHRQHTTLSTPCYFAHLQGSQLAGTVSMLDEYFSGAGSVALEMQVEDASVDNGKGLFRGISLTSICDSRTVSETIIGNLAAFAAMATLPNINQFAEEGGIGQRKNSKKPKSSSTKYDVENVSLSRSLIPETALARGLSAEYRSPSASLSISSGVDLSVTLQSASTLKNVARAALLEWFSKPASWHHRGDAVAAVGDAHVLCALSNQLHTEGELAASSYEGFSPSWGPSNGSPSELINWRRRRDALLLESTGYQDEALSTANRSSKPLTQTAMLAAFYASVVSNDGEIDPLLKSIQVRNDVAIDCGWQVARLLRHGRALGDSSNIRQLRSEAWSATDGNWWWHEGGDDVVYCLSSSSPATPFAGSTLLGPTFISPHTPATVLNPKRTWYGGALQKLSTRLALSQGTPALFPEARRSEFLRTVQGSPLVRKPTGTRVAFDAPIPATAHANTTNGHLVYYGHEAEPLNSNLLWTGSERRCSLVTKGNSTALHRDASLYSNTPTEETPHVSFDRQLPPSYEVLSTCVFSGRRPLSAHQVLQKQKRRRLRGILRRFRRTAVAFKRASRSAVSKGRKKMGDMRHGGITTRKLNQQSDDALLGLFDLQMTLAVVNSSLSIHALGAALRPEEAWTRSILASHIENVSLRADACANIGSNCSVQTGSSLVPLLSLQQVMDCNRRRMFDLMGALRLLVRHEHERLKVWSLAGIAKDTNDIGRTSVTHWTVVSSLTNEITKFPSLQPWVPPFCPALSTKGGTLAALHRRLFPSNTWLLPTAVMLDVRREQQFKRYGGVCSANFAKGQLERQKLRAERQQRGVKEPKDVDETDDEINDGLMGDVVGGCGGCLSALAQPEGAHFLPSFAPHPVPPPTRSFSQLVSQVTLPVWHLYCLALLNEAPSVIPQMVSRFPFSPVVGIAVNHAVAKHNSLFLADPVSIQHYLTPEVLLELSPKPVQARPKGQTRQQSQQAPVASNNLAIPLRYWSPCSITTSLRFLDKAYQRRYPTIAQYALTSLFTADPTKLIFFMPQLLQCLSFSSAETDFPAMLKRLAKTKNLATLVASSSPTQDSPMVPLIPVADPTLSLTSPNANPSAPAAADALTIGGFLLEQSHHSLEFCHQLLWSLNTECEDGDNPNLEPKCRELMSAITGSFSSEEREFYRNQFNFIASLIAVSGSLKPVEKSKRKEQLRTLLAKETALYQNPCKTQLLYLPTNPDQRIRELIPHTAGAMQSAAKCPILIQFKCDERDTETIQTSEPGGSGASPLSLRLKTRACIFKFGDDCRQDQLALQLAELFRRIFRDCGVPHFVFPYRVVTTAGNCGVIECVPNAMSRDQIGKLVEGSVGEYFIQRHGHPSTTAFKRARDCFVRSSASYAVVSYILNIKDRHNGNFMIDDAGNIIHIDFGFLFDFSPGGDMNFEASPFKLTSEMLRLLGDPLWDRKKITKITHRRKAAALHRRAGGLVRGDMSSITGQGAGSRKELAATLSARNPQSPLESLACPESYEKFVETTVRCFLAVRQYAKEICVLVELMLESGLPCFKPFKTIHDLQQRLGAHLQEKEAALLMHRMIEESRDNFRTYLYDKYQNFAERIEM